jgi:hypothetical protein
MTFICVKLLALRFEAHPAMQHEIGQPVSRGARERRRGIEPSSDLRSIDAQEPDTPDRGNVDRIAVDDRPYQHGIRPPQRGCTEADLRRGYGSHCQHQAGGGEQEFHRDLLCRDVARIRDRGCANDQPAREASNRYSTMPEATARFSESTPGTIGMRTR